MCFEGKIMPIIVAGNLKIKKGCRAEFINGSTGAIIQARKAEGCNDFAVSEDPIDENRVNIFEKWSSREVLEKFRGSGPEDDIFTLVEAFNVQEYEINT